MSRQFDTGGAPHFPPHSTVAGVMRQVLYAMVPGVAASAWYFGPGVLVQILLATVFALALEALFLKARGKPVGMFLSDYSAVVTAVLFAVCIPPLAPWWISLIGMIFAIGIAKHLYGGLGNNLFNPAMVGYVAVLISFPQALTAWVAPAELLVRDIGLSEVLASIFTGRAPGGVSWDAISSATVLDLVRNGTASGQTMESLRQLPAFGYLAGQGWEWTAGFYALGGLWLIWKRIITWHVPFTVLGSAFAFSAIAWVLNPGYNPSPAVDLLSGALIIGAFFIATDPVSGCTSTKGRVIFAAGVGILTLVIRRWGGYPDGVAFAVLLMNMAAPLIDRFTQPRIFGHD